MNRKETKKIVREGYAKVALQNSPCCGPVNSCCGTVDAAQEISRKVGYSDEELKAVPEGANLGLGCGNPVAIAALKEGETVLDLGSGPGLDCFLAADRVGKDGKVIGIDMTPEMLEKARTLAAKGKYFNVEFRLGEIESLPVDDNSVDVVISNCVINLSPDKEKVFQETFRILKPGGRIMVSDIVLLTDLPDYMKHSVDSYVGCISGAIPRDEYLKALKAAGFREVRIVDELAVPLEEWIQKTAVKKIAETCNISNDKVKKLLGTVVRVNITGNKAF